MGVLNTFRLVGLAAALVVVIAGAAVAESPAPTNSCARGRFRSGPLRPIRIGSDRPTAVSFDGTSFAVEGLCDPVQARVRIKKSGRTVIDARWPRCGTHRRVRVHAAVDGCDRIRGRLRARGLPSRRFEALRLRCGDELLDPTDGEECETDVDCRTGNCDAECRCAVPGAVLPTTTLPPRCGDGFTNGGETCDGHDLAGATCSDFGFFGGFLRCRDDCTIDTTACCVCGDGRRDTACGEVCDGGDLNGATCESRGYPEGGTLACYACISFDTNDCFVCGNGLREGPEECDDSDFGPSGNACTGGWPEHGGILSCTPGGLPTPQYADGACHIDRNSCFTCGDGHIEPGEQCDDGNLLPNDGCSDTCMRECGNGSVGRTEGCDDGNQTDGDGCSSACSMEPTYFGDAAEPYDECLLKWGVAAPETSGTQAAVTQTASGLTVACEDDATTGPNACDRDTTPGSCTIHLFYCMKNNSLGGTCSPRAITRVALLDPTPAGDALDASGQDAVVASFSDSMRAVGNAASVDPVSPLPGELRAVAPDVPVNTVGGEAPMCGAVAILVPRASGMTQRVLRMKVTDTMGRDDIDQVTLVCTP
jgi:cysteine-rich repeat protein